MAGSRGVWASFETRPDNPYDCAKDALRKQLQFLQSAQPYKLTWARLFYMYGRPPRYVSDTDSGSRGRRRS